MQRNIVISLIWAALPFLVLVLGLGHLQLPVADDLIYQKVFSEHGLWEGTQLLRNEWNTRWMSMLTLGAFFKLIPERWYGLTFQLTTLVLASSIFYAFIRRFATVSSPKALAISLYLPAILFLSTIGKADSWFWMCSTVTYIWPGLVSILLMILVFEKWNWKLIIPLIMAAALVGGGSEVIAIAVLTVLFSIKIFENRLPAFNNGMWVLATTVVISAFGYGLFGDGAQVRLDALPENSFGDKLLIGFKGYLSMLFLGIPKKLGALFIATISLSFLLKLRSPRPSLAVILGIADTILVVTFIILGLVMSEMGPKRSWFHIMLMMTALTAFLSMHIRPTGLWRKAARNLALIGNGFIGIYLWSVALDELPNAITYQQALIERTRHIEAEIAKGHRAIGLAPLPEPGMMYWAEITSDPMAPENQQLSLIYGEDVDFVLSEKAARSE